MCIFAFYVPLRKSSGIKTVPSVAIRALNGNQMQPADYFLNIRVALFPKKKFQNGYPS